MKKIYYLTKHFLKVFLAYKINFLAILIIPIISIVYHQSDRLFSPIPVEEYYSYLSLWLAYLVTVTAFTIGYEVVMLREQQFLKQMTFVVKNYRLVIYSKIITHFILLISTVTILVALSTVLFQIPFINLLLFSYGAVLLPFLPLSFIFLVLNVLPMHTENLQPIITVTTMAMLFFINFLNLFEPTSTLMTIINPMNFALETGKIWTQLFLDGVQINIFAVIITMILYFVIGSIALNKTRIVANFRM